MSLPAFVVKASVKHRFPPRLAYHRWHKPKVRERRLRGFTTLFGARMFALSAMRDLTAFEPRLRGAALSGRWYFGSFVELDVYSDRLSFLADRLRALGWRFDLSYYEHLDAVHPTFEVEGLIFLVLHVLPRDELLPAAPGIDHDALLSAVRSVHAAQIVRWCDGDAM